MFDAEYDADGEGKDKETYFDKWKAETEQQAEVCGISSLWIIIFYNKLIFVRKNVLKNKQRFVCYHVLNNEQRFVCYHVLNHKQRFMSYYINVLL